MAFLGEEVDGVLTAQKIRGEPQCTPNFMPTAATLHINSKHAKTAWMGKREIKHFVSSANPALIGPKTVRR
jgi:hypothetical protein